MAAPSTIPKRAATHNACKVCAPLGAAIAYRGIDGCVPLLHGGQGCATYIRRYLISHYREPVDIASSSFSETTAIFGGKSNFDAAIQNIVRQYKPKLVGAATTCLSETMGEDIRAFARDAEEMFGTPIAAASTPSYSSTHAEGFRIAVHALVERFAERIPCGECVAIFPGLVSPADLRHIRELVASFGLRPILVPDFSETLDGGNWTEFQLLPAGGTTLDELRSLGSVAAAIEFAGGKTKSAGPLSSKFLADKFGVPAFRLQPPTGVENCDALVAVLEQVSGRKAPAWLVAERARLLDAYVDSHKYFFGKRAAVFGDEDLVWQVSGLLREVGAIPAFASTGGRTGVVKELEGSDGCMTLEDADFETLTDAMRMAPPDLLIGTSKGFGAANTLGIPLLRCGFPTHDRFGASRRLQVGYRGTLALLDELANILLAHAQDSNPIGYKYY